MQNGGQNKKDRPVVICFGQPLENVFRSKYLGSLFTADGRQIHDIKVTVTMAFSCCDKLRHVLDSPDLSVPLKLRLYQAAVCSVLSYGCETWTLYPAVMRTINGVNNRMIVRFTGKTIPQEARKVSCGFDLVRAIRVRRFKWIGHILRVGPSRLTYQAVEEQFRMMRPGNTPPHS